MLSRKAEDEQSERPQRHWHVGRPVWACRGTLWYRSGINCSRPSAGLHYPPLQEAPLHNRKVTEWEKLRLYVCEMFEQVKYWKMAVVCLLGFGTYTIDFDWFSPLKDPPAATCCHGFPRFPGRVGLTRSEAERVQISRGTRGWAEPGKTGVHVRTHTHIHAHTGSVVLTMTWYTFLDHFRCKTVN